MVRPGHENSSMALNGRIHPVAQLVHPFRQVEGSHARDAWAVRGLARVSLVNPTALFRDTSAARAYWRLWAAPTAYVEGPRRPRSRSEGYQAPSTGVDLVGSAQ